MHIMANYIIPFHCEHDNYECLYYAKMGFDRIKSGEITLNDINVELQFQIIKYGIRLGDESDAKWVEDQMFAKPQDKSNFKNCLKSLRMTKKVDYAIQVRRF